MERLTHKARYEAGYKLNKGVKEWQAGQDNDIAFENAAELWNRRADNE